MSVFKQNSPDIIMWPHLKKYKKWSRSSWTLRAPSSGGLRLLCRTVRSWCVHQGESTQRSGIPKKLFKAGFERSSNGIFPPIANPSLLLRANQRSNWESIPEQPAPFSAEQELILASKSLCMSQLLAFLYHKALQAVSNRRYKKVYETFDTSPENLQDLLSELTWCLTFPLHGCLQELKPPAQLHGFFPVQ